MSNFHGDPLPYSHVGCSVHQPPCSLAGCLAGVLFQPFCPAQTPSALACTMANPGGARRGSQPAAPVQVIQKRDGQGSAERTVFLGQKSQHSAEPQRGGGTKGRA